MKHMLTLFCGLAFFAGASTALAQIEWAQGAPDGTPNGSVEFRTTDNLALATGISADLIGGNRGDANNLSTATSYTISAWIYSTEDDGAGNAADNRWWLGTGDEGIHLGIFGNNTLQHGHWGSDNTGTSVVAANTWVHSTYVFDAVAGDVTIYIDGEEDGSGPTLGPNRSDTDLVIGARFRDGNIRNGEGWGGRIDDVAIFTSALTEAQVTTLFNDTTQAVQSLGAAAYYNFEDDQTGTTAANLVPVAASGLTGTDGSPALQELDGIGAGLPTVAEWTMGAPGGTSTGALRFDGTGGLRTGIASALVAGNRGTDAAPTLGTDYTISAWINSSEDDGAGLATNQRWWIGTEFQGLHLGVDMGNTLHQGHWNQDSNGVTQVPVDTWVHATYTYDADGGAGGATGLITIYYDGQFDSSAEVGAPNNSTTDLIIGARNGGGNGWVGSLDDIAIFTRVLTSGEVSMLYDDAAQAASLGAAAYYDFEDDQTGSTAASVGSFGSPALDGIGPATADCILADVSMNGIVDFNDIPDFVTVLLMGPFQCEADCDENGQVDFNDIPFFVNILLGL